MLSQRLSRPSMTKSIFAEANQGAVLEQLQDQQYDAKLRFFEYVTVFGGSKDTGLKQYWDVNISIFRNIVRG